MVDLEVSDVSDEVSVMPVVELLIECVALWVDEKLDSFVEAEVDELDCAVLRSVTGMIVVDDVEPVRVEGEMLVLSEEDRWDVWGETFVETFIVVCFVVEVSVTEEEVLPDVPEDPEELVEPVDFELESVAPLEADVDWVVVVVVVLVFELDEEFVGKDFEEPNVVVVEDFWEVACVNGEVILGEVSELSVEERLDPDELVEDTVEPLVVDLDKSVVGEEVGVSDGGVLECEIVLNTAVLAVVVEEGFDIWDDPLDDFEMEDVVFSVNVDLSVEVFEDEPVDWILPDVDVLRVKSSEEVVGVEPVVLDVVDVAKLVEDEEEVLVVEADVSSAVVVDAVLVDWEVELGVDVETVVVS